MTAVCAGDTKLIGDSAETLISAISGEDTDTVLTSFLEEVARQCSREPKNSKSKSNDQPGRNQPKGDRASEKAKMYKTHQHLFSKDKKALASLIQPMTRCLINI